MTGGSATAAPAAAPGRTGRRARYRPVLVLLALVLVIVASWLPGSVYHRLLPWSAPWFNHFLAYAVLGTVVARAWSGSRGRWLAAAAALVLLASAMELGQHLAPTRFPRWTDWAWGVTGALCGLLLGSLLRRRRRQQASAAPAWWSPTADDASRLRDLGRHRLWPHAGLLAGRGLIPRSLADAAVPLAHPMRVRMQRRAAEERRVTTALAAAGCRFLVLKGCLLAHSLYADPRDRYREDLDILVPLPEREQAGQLLASLGYRPSQPVAGGSPMTQRQWRRPDPEGEHFVDLHWDLRNHPRLQGRLDFDELAQAAQPLPGLADGVFGLGAGHALLHAVMHHFDHHGQEAADQELLDIDLLWRRLSAAEQAALVAEAGARGLSGLLAAALAQAHARLATPVADELLEACRRQGARQPASALLAARHNRWRAHWLAWRSQPGWRARWQHLRALVLPPAAYMRHQYPEGSRLGLPGLYLRRLWQRLRG